MMRSLYSGVSGLKVHQAKMDVIGNNISNVNTTGFKSSRVTFTEVFSQTLQGASAASDTTGRGGTNPMQIGLGANVASIDTIMTEGAAQRTDRPLDVKIEGDGFFIVNDGSGNKFTRAGAFRYDGAGNLTAPGGLKVQGWLANDIGEIEKTTVTSLPIMSPRYAYAEPAQTTDITVSGNINSEDSQFDTTGGYEFPVDFYDSLGYKYTATLSLKRESDTEYSVDVTSVVNEKGEDLISDGLTVSTTPDTTTNFITFETTGEIDPTTAGLNSFELDFGDWDTVVGVSEIDPIDIDLSQLTHFAGSTDLDFDRGDLEGRGAGRPVGEMTGFSVGPDGKVFGTYSNGESKLICQIPIAKFKNPAGLEKVGNNLFQVTPNSGEFDGIGEDPTAGGGSLNSGVLEMSNVDLSSEFTEMITTQRGFQANSRIITVSDEMLQELANLKR